MITAAQVRAARGLLDWSRSELAKASAVSPETIKNIEHGNFRPQEQTEEAIIRAFAAHGVEFTENEGVRLVRDSVIRFEGKDGFKRFVDNIYTVVQSQSAQECSDKPIYASNFNDDMFAHHLGDYLSLHVQRMNNIPNLKVKILSHSRAAQSSAPKSRGANYRECRIPVGLHSGEAPFYVYGDNLAVIVLDGNAVQIIVISSAPVAKAYRQLFNAIWENAKPLTEE